MANLQLISSLAEKRNLSIDQLAAEVGLKRGAIYKMINENSTKIETLEKIAKALGVPTGYFFDDFDQNQYKPNSKIKTFLAFEVDESQEEKVIKMVMGKEFIKMMNL